MSTETTTQPMISDAACEAAAAWWAKAMERPKYDAMGKERDSSMELAQVMMSMIQAKNPTTPGQLDTFRDTLASRLRHEVKSLRTPWVCLGVDYHPCEMLESAAIAAGIDMNACPFPIKTNVWLDDKGVTVRHGYGAAMQTIYTEAA